MASTQGCSLVDNYDWDTKIAHAVCMAESGGNPNADNTGLNQDGSNDKGLMGINSIHSDLISDLDRLDPVKNVEAGYQIYKGGGWKPWSSFNNNSYRRFL